MLVIGDSQPLVTKDGYVLSARRLTRADAAALQRFGKELDAESRRKFTPHRYDDAALEILMSRSEKGIDYTVAGFDGEKLATYFFLWNFTEPVPGLGIGMRNEYQHRGLGRPMMEHLIEAARENGCDGVELTTMLDNHNAFALYEKCGFRYFGNVENVSGDGKVTVERGMFLALKPGAKRTGIRIHPPVV